MPDNATAEKVPGIPGLLEYRKDQKKLYLRANKTWNLLTQEKEVKIYRLKNIHCIQPLCLSPFICIRPGDLGVSRSLEMAFPGSCLSLSLGTDPRGFYSPVFLIF